MRGGFRLRGSIPRWIGEGYCAGCHDSAFLLWVRLAEVASAETICQSGRPDLRGLDPQRSGGSCSGC